MRVDWEICFHCGVRRPARTRAATGFRLTSALLLLCLVVAAGLNVAAVWSMIRGAPRRIAEQVATTAPAAAARIGKVVPAVPKPEIDAPTLPDAGRELVAIGERVGREAREHSARGEIELRRPDLEGPTLSIRGAMADSVACGSAADSIAALPLDAPIVGRAIAACPSAGALDSLEERLRASHPGDSRLEPGGRLERRIQARRAALTGS